MQPLIDLHVHLPGTVRATTLQELADKNDVHLPMPTVELYKRINSDPTEEEQGKGPWFPLLRIYELICDSLQTRDDFARVVYEALEDGLHDSGVIYSELAFSPSVHMRAGVKYGDMASGISDGFTRARSELGVDGRALGAVNREDTPAVAVQMVEEMAANPCPDIVGVGLDFYELAGMPEHFTEAYQLAKRHGLHRTAHAGEHAPTAQTVATALDQLHCERIDHGYQILRDGAIVRRCADEGIIFNIAFTTSRRALRPWRRESVVEMVQQGLRVTVNSDDPSLFPTTVRREMEIAQRILPSVPQDWYVRNAIDACFLDEAEKQELAKRALGSAA